MNNKSATKNKENLTSAIAEELDEFLLARLNIFKSMEMDANKKVKNIWTISTGIKTTIKKL